MNSEDKAKIREALRWYAEIECPGPAEEALALLDAEDKPSVPMAILESIEKEKQG